MELKYTAEMHEQDLAGWFTGLMSSKYRAGQEEHGGRLWRKPMVNHMIEEIVDLAVYMGTHRVQMLKVKGLLFEALENMMRAEAAGVMPIPGRDAVQQAFNLMIEGNVEGEEEEERG